MKYKYEYVYGRWKRLWRLWQSTMSISKLMTPCFLHWFSPFLNFDFTQIYAHIHVANEQILSMKPMKYEVNRYRYEFRESNVNHFTYSFISNELRVGRWSLDYNFMTKTTRSHFFFHRKSMRFVHQTSIRTKNEFEYNNFRFEVDKESWYNIVSI